MGLIAVMLPPGGACENALPKDAASIVLIDITTSNTEVNTPVASKFTFIKVLEAARVITENKDDLRSWLMLSWKEMTIAFVKIKMTHLEDKSSGDLFRRRFSNYTSENVDSC